eukprot:TRINITY_DN2180_c0_g1_i1.p1 TRINITY_DN2180_c0_g1~~TRINITY_DN2180_c0_g1_i1.p1  ORF type:complete len:177 (-),score=27.33 TRINITY_DN2180_c0_g1_i1:105-635(-)
MALFGCIVPGMAPQTGFQQMDERRWALPFHVPLQSDRIVVFLTGQAPLPPNTGAGVYLSRMGESTFEYIGFLTNDSPSGIFTMPMSFVNNVSPNPLCLGVSLETLGDLQNLEGHHLQAKQRYLSRRFEMGKKMAEDLFNFLQSFTPAVNVPPELLGRWLERLQTKMLRDSKFLEDC